MKSVFDLLRERCGRNVLTRSGNKPLIYGLMREFRENLTAYDIDAVRVGLQQYMEWALQHGETQVCDPYVCLLAMMMLRAVLSESRDVSYDVVVAQIEADVPDRFAHYVPQLTCYLRSCQASRTALDRAPKITTSPEHRARIRTVLSGHNTLRSSSAKQTRAGAVVAALEGARARRREMAKEKAARITDDPALQEALWKNAGDYDCVRCGRRMSTLDACTDGRLHAEWVVAEAQ